MITGQTRLYAIIADPVHHVQTPQMFNARFAERGIDAVLVPVHARPGRLRGVLEGFRAMENLGGIVVTVPHKAAIVDLLDRIEAEGREAGACNAVRRDPDGTLVGTMFDGEGFVAGLRAHGHEVRGKRVFLAGAGGAGSGIAFGIARHGATHLTIYNRTREKAEDLAARVRAAYPVCAAVAGGPDPAGHDIVVNATSLGMAPGDAAPLDLAGLAPPMLAAEIIMAPETTPFLAAAKARGCAVHYGRPMLAEQLRLIAGFMGIQGW